MATILDRYGVKEVMDGTFYQITEDGNIGAPVLYLDSLKVSTVEQTAENTSARVVRAMLNLCPGTLTRKLLLPSKMRSSLLNP